MARRNVSVYGLAKSSGVMLSTVQKLCAGESRNPGGWTLKRLADPLGVTVDYLLGVDAWQHGADHG